MTMLLAKRDDEWFLAAFAPHLRGCNLSTNQRPRHQVEKFHLWQGRIWVQSEAPLNGITFYPEIYYRHADHRYRVYPWHGWNRESTEPLLHCLLDHALLSKAGSDWERQMRDLIADGWQWDQRTGGLKYVHVDDLEKIEGPPPDGAF